MRPGILHIDFPLAFGNWQNSFNTNRIAATIHFTLGNICDMQFEFRTVSKFYIAYSIYLLKRFILFLSFCLPSNWYIMHNNLSALAAQNCSTLCSLFIFFLASSHTHSISWLANRFSRHHSYSFRIRVIFRDFFFRACCILHIVLLSLSVSLSFAVCRLTVFCTLLWKQTMKKKMTNNNPCTKKKSLQNHTTRQRNANCTLFFLRFILSVLKAFFRGRLALFFFFGLNISSCMA